MRKLSMEMSADEWMAEAVNRLQEADEAYEAVQKMTMIGSHQTADALMAHRTAAHLRQTALVCTEVAGFKAIDATFQG